MPINIPENSAEVSNRVKSDIQRELATSNPFLKNSWLHALAVSFSNRIYEFYFTLQSATKQNFPDTATDEFLERWASFYGVDRLVATQATGQVVFSGQLGSSIPSGTTLSIGSNIYETVGSATISDKTVFLSSLTRVGSTATATTATPHGLANNTVVTIYNSTNSEYDAITSDVTVTSLTTFQYPITGTPPNELSTGAILDYLTASVTIKSIEFGQDFNLDAGSVLTLQSPIALVSNSATVDFGAIGGGTDTESDAALRVRLLADTQNPLAHFNVPTIENSAKQIAGVTRVFVQEATPLAGQVTINFMRDNDSDPIPSASEVLAVKDQLLTIKPASITDSDVIVSAPTAVSVDFIFSAIAPSSTTIKNAVEENLALFFKDQTDVSTNITEDAYRSIIFNTVDANTGDKVTSFTLTTPTTDVAINTGEIGVLGSVSFT